MRPGERSSITVVGLGKLGLPMAALLSARGHNVIGVDVDKHTTAALSAGKILLEEPGVRELFSKRPFKVDTDAARAAGQTDATFIIVPTPTGPNGKFVNDYVRQAVAAVCDGVKGKEGRHLLVISSTVMPGTCDRELIPMLTGWGLTPGSDIDLCYSPEFIALGSVIADMTEPDMVLIGATDPRAGGRLEKILAPTWGNAGHDEYSRPPKPKVHHMSLVDAEIAKMALNTYVTMKISFANTLGALCERVGGDAHVVAEAIGDDRRVGGAYLKPGAAYGGPCFPRDTDAFLTWAQDHRVDAPLVAATAEVNRRQALRIGEMVMRCKERTTGAKTRRVAVLGAAYKPGTPVVDCSPGIDVARYLAYLGFDVVLTDPVAKDPGVHGIGWTDDAADAIAEAHVAVIMTAHSEYAGLVYPGDVIDCWRLVPAPQAEGHVHRIGVGR